ncbi:MAG: T9SS type A sorting domain-containing protein [bacterium]
MKKVILFIAFVLIFARPSFAEIIFDTQHPLNFPFDGPDCVEIVDVNKDGLNDIVACSKFEDMAVWFENKGFNNYVGHIIGNNVGGARSIHTADFDLDGDYDFVVACWNDSKVIIYENLGNEQYKEVVVEANADGTRVCGINDIDNDGDMDIVYGSNGTELALFVNNGNMNFTKKTIPGLNAECFRFISFGDVNKDGLTDIITASWCDGSISLYLNNGSYNFTPQELHTSEFAMCAKPVDFDNDGNMEIIWCAYGSSKVGFLKNDGNGNFSNTDIATVNGAYYISIADIDGDSDNDIYVSSFSDNKVYWIETTSPSNYTKREIFGNAVQSHCVVATDFDKDGDMDAVSASPGPALNGLGNIVLHENKGGGKFANTIINTQMYSTIDLVTGDFDQDGDVDVIGASYYSENIVFYENVYPKKYSPRVLIEGLVGLRKLNSVDFNNDGLFDLVSVSWWDNKVALHINQGNMKFKTILLDTFSRKNEMNETKRRPCWCETVDLDKDGKLDIVVAYFGSDEVIWYKNMGGYKFQTIVITKNTKGIECVIVKDLDKDGDLDLVTASWDDDKVSWFENTGGNKYVEHIISTDVDYASSVFCEDMDSDGDIDILATAFNGDQLYWFENDGKQKFYRHLISDKVDGARTVIAANLDNQGLPEVVCASWWGCDVQWFNNDGGSFTPSIVKNKLMRAGALQVADMDLDGDLDIVTASASENKIAWYENRFVQIIPPVLLFPTENALSIVQNTDLIWDKAPYTMKYQIQLAGDYEFTNILLDTIQTFTSIRLSDNFCNSNRVYYWRVKSYGQVEKSGWSEIRTFETGKQFSEISGLTTPSEALINVNPSVLVQSVRINAYMPKSGLAEVSLIDVSGREVKELFNGYMEKGDNVFILEKGDIVPGMYYLLLKTTDTQKAIKVIVQ